MFGGATSRSVGGRRECFRKLNREGVGLVDVGLVGLGIIRKAGIGSEVQNEPAAEER